MSHSQILVLGASGYIGTQCVGRLLEQGHSVLAASHHLSRLSSAPWAKHKLVKLCEINVLDKNSLKKACANCSVVYYFVHSMSSQNKNFEMTDRVAAENMREAALAQGVKRIIFLSGLGDNKLSLSRHLRSRMEVSEILQAGKVPVTTLRAAMIIGRGSISFEIMRYLVEHFPLMITSNWINTESQPIAIENVLNYLSGVLQNPKTSGQIYDIGGPEIVTYRQLMGICAQEAGLPKRLIIPIPFMTMKLNSYLIQSAAPFPPSIVRPLTESLMNKVVCQDNRIKEIIPQDLLDCRQAIREALT